MQIWSRKNLSGASLLVGALVVGNFLNFAFNAFLGRELSYEQFGLLTFYNTILYLAGIFFTALGNTVNHRTAYLNGKHGHDAGMAFTQFVRKWTMLGMGVAAVLWLISTPVLNSWFRVNDMFSLVLFAPLFIFGAVSGINKGYLQGNLKFMAVAIIFLVEPLVKLAVAGFLVWQGLENWVYVSIPISLGAAFATSIIYVMRIKKENIASLENVFKFPKRFFTAAAVTGLSATAFLSFDLVMVKHYLDPVAAGEYSLLSLVGKMIYFLGGLLNGLMITFISHEEGSHQNSRKTFYRLFGAALALVTAGVLAFGALGQTTIPILFGNKVVPILPYLMEYALAIGFYTLASVIVLYHLAKEEYSFSVLTLVMTGLMGLGIVWQHGSIQAVVDIIFWISLMTLALASFLHWVQRNSRFILANLVDLIDLVKPLSAPAKLASGGKRILVFNWRDTKHAYAGGAEVYIHELAKRWVGQGNQVTLFCGNDGKSARNETIDGIRIIRRGGFYTVYVWAIIYYVTHFRGRFDLILDCQNGIPFFTPLYAKEKIYSLLFHVHQNVFYKYMPKPLAMFAAVLENRLMPYVYKRVKFLTISESSKQDMEKIDLSENGIEVIFPGVDLSAMRPGEKSPQPTVLYLGRLKAYKSVHVLIQSFKAVLEQLNNARLIIAGSGEEEGLLKKLAHDLGISARVEFMGKVSDQEKIKLMQSAWVFVNPSMMEGWGITTIEANACGTPVLAADVPGLRDSVKNPHTGFLVPHGNAQAMADKLLLLLTNPENREEMSLNAVEWAGNFDWSKSSQKFLNIINA